MDIRTVNIKDIRPYPNNPRKNDGAVAAVAESIKQCGYCSPIVVDEDMVVLAGHTRLRRPSNGLAGRSARSASGKG